MDDIYKNIDDNSTNKKITDIDFIWWYDRLAIKNLFNRNRIIY